MLGILTLGAFWIAGGWICTEAVVRQEFTLIRDQTKTVNMRSPVIKCSTLTAWDFVNMAMQ